MQNMRDNFINLKWLNDPELDTDFDQLTRYECCGFLQIKPIDISIMSSTYCTYNSHIGRYVFIYVYIILNTHSNNIPI